MSTEKPTVGLQRNTIDKFYTKGSIAETCIRAIREHVYISNTADLIIEPSAGNGGFIPHIKTMSPYFRFYDIEPQHNDIIQQDYLTLPVDRFKDQYAKIHLVGNPPFGRQSSLAIKFIKKSCGFCDSICFILPKSFKKESMQKAFPARFHLIYEMDLPDKSFLVDGLEYGVDTVFQIWVKKYEDRVILEKAEPRHFAFVNKTENPDISFRRVGVYAGKIDVDIEKSEQSHYFIKFDTGHMKMSITEIIEKLKNVTFHHNNTVGPRSISKPELIREFNRCLQI